MAMLPARDSAIAPGLVTIADAQTGNGDTTHVADRGESHKRHGTLVRICAGAGATPTCTYQIKVSADGTNWVNATYADLATPLVDSTATFNITTDSTVRKIIKHAQTWRYVKVTMSANTNVTNWIDVVFNDLKAFI